MAPRNSRPDASTRRHRRPASRRGAVAVLAALLMIAMFGMLAFALDLGILLVARTELQRTADAAAMAAAWQLVTGPGRTAEELEEAAREVAVHYAARNAVLHASPTVDYNPHNAPDGDVLLGTLDDLSNPDDTFYAGYPDSYNAVQVRVRRTAERNGEVPYFFARVLGLDGMAAEAVATAAVVKRVGGFRPPASGDNLPILPVAIHLDAWHDLLSGITFRDDWAYTSSKTVEPQSDGMPELALYPETTGSSGNLGTIDIGPANNSTDHLSTQIREGISAADLNHHGGELRLDSRGELQLNGDTGLSAAIQNELAGIVGQSRVIPVYRDAFGSGNNATFTIVKFVGVRVMNVQLSGGEKAIVIQPAEVVVRGTIPADSAGTSDYVYSPAYLFR